MVNRLRNFDGRIKDELGIYVYGLVDLRTNPGRVFYVGKGGGNFEDRSNLRLFDHFWATESAVATGNVLTSKQQTISNVWGSGQDVAWHIFRRRLSH